VIDPGDEKLKLVLHDSLPFLKPKTAVRQSFHEKTDADRQRRLQKNM
jgi:hypothetical protein